LPSEDKMPKPETHKLADLIGEIIPNKLNNAADNLTDDKATETLTEQ